MRFLANADWAFGFFWAAFTAFLFIAANALILGQAINLEFILANMALWSVSGIFMSIALGLKRSQI